MNITTYPREDLSMNIATAKKRKSAPNPLPRLAGVLNWGEATSTPEWRAMQQAFESNNRPVLAVALEVFVSHYSERFSSAQKLALRCLAQNFRAGF